MKFCHAELCALWKQEVTSFGAVMLKTIDIYNDTRNNDIYNDHNDMYWTWGGTM